MITNINYSSNCFGFFNWCYSWKYISKFTAKHEGWWFFPRQGCVLASTNEIVTHLNEYVLSSHPRDERIYVSLDLISKSDGYYNNNKNAFSIKFINTFKCSGIPNYEICLKKRALVMLFRNIDPSVGLFNGTTLVIHHLGITS